MYVRKTPLAGTREVGFVRNDSLSLCVIIEFLDWDAYVFEIHFVVVFNILKVLFVFLLKFDDHFADFSILIGLGDECSDKLIESSDPFIGFIESSSEFNNFSHHMSSGL